MIKIRNLTLVAVLAAALILTACTTQSAPEPGPTEAGPTASHSPIPDPIIDSGPVDGARGTTETDADGVLRYTVVEGDVGGIVCDRFDRAYWQLETNLDKGGFSCNGMISIGEILTPTNDVRP